MKTTWTDIMGLPITLQLVGVDGAVEAKAAAEVRTWLQHVDAVFSTYKNDSEISRMNAGALTVDAASDEVREVLATSARLREETGGYFDIEHGGRIDPSGYVKGWAVKRATERLEERGIKRYCLEAGGDIQAAGAGPSGEAWRVGITNPLEPTTLAKVLHIKDGAVATSGSYKRGAHIYNPLTRQPVIDPISLTVIGKRIDEVDAAATAALCMGREGLEWLARHDYEGMLISAAGEVWLTDGFKRYELASA